MHVVRRTVPRPLTRAPGGHTDLIAVARTRGQPMRSNRLRAPRSVLLTALLISPQVSAGIPDFRTPGSVLPPETSRSTYTGLVCVARAGAKADLEFRGARRGCTRTCRSMICPTLRCARGSRKQQRAVHASASASAFAPAFAPAPAPAAPPTSAAAAAAAAPPTSSSPWLRKQQRAFCFSFSQITFAKPDQSVLCSLRPSSRWTTSRRSQRRE